VIQEITDLEMLGDRKIDVVLVDLEKSLGGLLSASETLGEIGPDAISVEHRSLFFLEGNEYRDSETFHNALSLASHQGKAIEAWLCGDIYLGAAERLPWLDESAVAKADPAVLQRGRIAVDIERILNAVARHRELEQNTSAFTESGGGGSCHRDPSRQECSERLFAECIGSLELKSSEGGNDNHAQRHDQRGAFMAMQIFAGEVCPPAEIEKLHVTQPSIKWPIGQSQI